MYATVRSCLDADLERDGLPATTPTYWMVIRDRAGTACSRVDPSADNDAPANALHAVFDRDDDVQGAALVSLVRPHGSAELLAAVVVRRSQTSDLRRAKLVKLDSGLVIVGPWEYTL